MKVKPCRPEILKEIIVEWQKRMRKPHLVPEPKEFFLEDQKYLLNLANPMVRSSMIQAQVVQELLPYGSDEDFYSYSLRIDCVFLFIRKNKEQLKKLDLYRSAENHDLIAHCIYDAASTCKLGNHGFKFSDMIREIKRLGEVD